MKKSFFTILFYFIVVSINAQKVGLVLSGGGANGFAHIGVLKALEENNIPIDYITGTSAGALVGALYACGFSPEQIQQLVLDESFQNMASGKINENDIFYLYTEDNDASIVDLPFSRDSILLKSLPTNFFNSILLDYEMMQILGKVGAFKNKDFDKLFVPFRSVSSDIYNKKSVVFKSGDLNLVVRTSLTFPFFIAPISIDGKLLFDGGLYNNFPLDVMYQEFSPDFIIGSNVTSNASKPKENDFLSQLFSMMMTPSNFSLPCEQGIIISPETELNTFAFSEIEKAINAGYNATILKIDSIKTQINRSISKTDLQLNRIVFSREIPELKINEIQSFDNKMKPVKFITNSMLRKQKYIDSTTLRKRYFKISSIEQIENLIPSISFRDSLYQLNLHAKKSKDFKLEVGGHYSSRPINTAYIGLSYLYLKKIGLKWKNEAYFGRFYGSVGSSIDLVLPRINPIIFNPYFTMNRWDYFRSSATFFEDVKPSFLVQNELYFGLKIKHSVSKKGKSSFDYRLFEIDDSYYQTNNFTSIDTADETRFKGQQLAWHLEFNSLNRKQFANAGNLFSLKFRYVSGQERSVSGSTSPIDYDEKKQHDWIQLNLEVQQFILNKKRFHFGLHSKTILNSQSLFKNYTATLLNTTEFAPFPDLYTFFQPEYRAPQHVGIGTNIILEPFKNFEFRVDAYYYQPIKKLVLNEDGTFGYSKILKGESFLYSFSAIYHSPIGPLRATFNYFPIVNDTLSFQLSYGFLLFNERAIR